MLSSGGSSKQTSSPERKPEPKKKKQQRRLDASLVSSSTQSKKKRVDPNILDLTFEEDEPEISVSSSDEESGQPREGCYQCQPQASSNSEFDDSIQIESLRKKCK
jgi:hypothetical protein